MAHFLYFLLMAAKKHSVLAKHLMHLKDRIKSFQKMVWVTGFEVTVREILRVEM